MGDFYKCMICVRRYFVPTEEMNSKGNPITMPVVMRSMYLLLKTPCASGAFTDWKIVRYRRNNEWKFSVSKPVKKPAYLKREWKRVESMGECDFVDWLRRRIGHMEAVSAINELLTAEPTPGDDSDF